YLSSYLKSKGFNVGVFDSTFSSLDAFKALIARDRPDIVGLYTNMMTKRNVLAMAAWCKQHGAIVILGGPEPPYYAREYLQAGADIIAKGEGELTLEELIPHLTRFGCANLDFINGIVFLNADGQPVETLPRAFIPDLSAHPWPDREAIDIPAYMRAWKEHHGQSSISVIHARGCPYTCKWCSHSVYGNTHRRRTPEDAADELLWIKERYNPDLIWYADDVFTINYRWLFDYAAALKQRGVRIPFECISRADRLNDEVVKTLADMGCYRLWNGSESGSQRVLDAMDRKVKVKDVQQKTHLLQQHGIETGMFIMLGYEGETIEDLEATVEHLKICN
ncbi:MAG: B12-binding domain-containing radical SAM protein, partial [Anaerolineae bacterium]|nr:B12-binding domain-containing radical SAM protein [Anaerolineae bacterium]